MNGVGARHTASARVSGGSRHHGGAARRTGIVIPLGSVKIPFKFNGLNK
jgi:hypothetical protein